MLNAASCLRPCPTYEPACYSNSRNCLLPVGQHPLCLLILIRAPVFLCCLLDSLTGCIPHAESGDLHAVISTQQCRTRDAYQVQAVAVAEKRLSLIAVDALECWRTARAFSSLIQLSMS